MFTGIVQELALVDKVTSSSFGISLEIARPIAFADIVIGESIALNGACLTVASYSSKIISFDVVKETLDKTNIKYLEKGHSVNLERCMKLSSRIEGHIVLGHVESTATVLRHIKDGESSRLSVAVDDKTLRYCIIKGSITIDGVSLTIASIDGNIIEVSLMAITIAIGALKKAHITREYAKKEAKPPPKKIHFALPIIFDAVPGETNLQ